jgi:hypothetical protein
MTVETKLNIEFYKNKTISFKEYKELIKKLGYKLESNKIELDITTDGNIGYCIDCIIEIDTKISAFHYKDARRDENFDKLQFLRQFVTVKHKGHEVFI